ncbi:hypothetical protein PR202_ga27948 [Eleusine coracana subsp. coracana]|uniref:Uncharacterized protein n=1 Tax=Eleusine coracana subsp. coracana TaxID=191504 RepID=A0AAV5DFW1_ELECO|nr:hypothetical protein PR202_ga27948 [Eleusine coracana subsp. coracana]
MMEWYADGATEFLRFMEVGGTPCRHMPFDSLVKHLFAGKQLHHKILRGNGHPSFLLWLVPYRTADHGIEATLKIIHKYGNAPEKNFFLGVMLQISEHTDIVGIVIKCLQLFPPHFQSTIEIIKQELFELPTQDFSWMPCVDLIHWDSLHSFSTQWFRPDPLCCKQHDQNKLHRTSNLSIEGLGDAKVSCIEYNKQRASLSECKNSLQDSPHVQVGLLYTLHGSPEKTCCLCIEVQQWMGSMVRSNIPHTQTLPWKN